MTNHESLARDIALLKENFGGTVGPIAGALRRVLSAQEWKPIATCPEGRTVLLFAVSDIDEAGVVRNWKMHTGSRRFGWRKEDAYPGETEWTWNGNILNVYDLHPTHWMPLPAPPTEATA